MSELFDLWYEYGYWRGIMNGAALIAIVMLAKGAWDEIRRIKLPTDGPEGEREVMKKITLTYDDWCKEANAAGDSDGSRCPVCREGSLFGIKGDFNQAFMKCTNGNCAVTYVVTKDPESVWFRVTKEQARQYHEHS